MSQVGLEPKIPVFGRAKTVHALDRVATVIGFQLMYSLEATRYNHYVRITFEKTRYNFI
jgi:hypothetical protein